MLVLIGKSASGKDTIKEILVKKYGFHPIVTYTTRPMRKDEIADITYHYISNEDFITKIEEGFFAEWKKYHIGEETWYYGSAKDDLKNADNDAVVILTPDGVRDIKNNGIAATVIYLYSNLSTIKNRLKARNDSNDKAEDRIQRDSKDFKDAEVLANKIVYNNDEMDVENAAELVALQYRKAIIT